MYLFLIFPRRSSHSIKLLVLLELGQNLLNEAGLVLYHLPVVSNLVT